MKTVSPAWRMMVLPAGIWMAGQSRVRVRSVFSCMGRRFRYGFGDGFVRGPL